VRWGAPEELAGAWPGGIKPALATPTHTLPVIAVCVASTDVIAGGWKRQPSRVEGGRDAGRRNRRRVHTIIKRASEVVCAFFHSGMALCLRPLHRDVLS
jgi:hypothetical protein